MMLTNGRCDQCTEHAPAPQPEAQPELGYFPELLGQGDPVLAAALASGEVQIDSTVVTAEDLSWFDQPSGEEVRDREACVYGCRMCIKHP